ncbi:cobalamin-binding protein [Bacillus sp. JJ722]|uniref:cobalamin-binding protein n=1 Tax=Bacillus sp. JJ722 TaxID=3122973 RepID=UPI003000431C
MKIISLCPSNTELCATLEIADLLIGVDDYSDYPEFIQSLPRLGPDLSINMDQVEALQPDLVLASLSVPGMEKNVAELEKRNIPHLVLNPNSLQEIANDLLIVGEALGITKKAKEQSELFLAEIEKYRAISNTIVNKKKLYWEWWPNPLFTPGGKNWLTEISELAGGQNIFKDVDLASAQVQHHDVIERNPEHILLAWVGVAQHRIKPELVLKRQGWDQITAIQTGQINVMEEPLYCRPSPRLLEGLKKLANLLHPDTF